ALSDLFCFASSAETFLLSAVEALSCGVPVVGFDLPVVREIVNENLGILTKNNSKDLAEKIKFIISREEITKNMAESGRNFVLNNYSESLFINKYSDIYNSIKND